MAATAPWLLQMWMAMTAEAFRQGAHAFVHDVRLEALPWGGSLDATTVPVDIWHGLDDMIVRSELPRAVPVATAATVDRTRTEECRAAMALPRWLAQVNKRVFNPREIRRGARPVLIHSGRSSGRTYQTPLDAHPLPDGYLFIPMYGPRTDWLKNVLAAQRARLSLAGQEIELESPRLVTKRDVWPLLPTTTKTPPGISDDSQLLRMDLRRPG